jgi:hypothetical protein
MPPVGIGAVLFPGPNSDQPIVKQFDYSLIELTVNNKGF